MSVNSKDRRIWEKISTEVCTKSPSGIIPISVLAQILGHHFSMGNIEDILNAIAAMSDPFALDCTNYGPYNPGLIGYKLKEKYKKSARVNLSETYKYENDRYIPYISDFTARSVQFSDVIRNVMDKGFPDDRIDKDAFKAAMYNYGRMHPECMNIIRVKCDSDRNLVLALNQYFRRNLHITSINGDNREFYITGCVVHTQHDSLKPSAPAFALPIKEMARKAIKRDNERKKLLENAIPLVTKKGVDLVGEVTKVEPPIDVEVVVVDDTTGKEVKPAEIETVIEVPKDVAIVAATIVKPEKPDKSVEEEPVIIKPSIKLPNIEEYLRKMRKNEGTYKEYVLKGVIEWLFWIKPHVLDTGEKDESVTTEEIYTAWMHWANHVRKRKVSTYTELGSIALSNKIAYCQDMYLKCTGLPNFVNYFDTDGGKAKLVGFKLDDELTKKLFPEKIVDLVKAKPASIPAKVEVKTETVWELTRKMQEEAKKVENKKEGTTVDINTIKRKLGLEALKMSKGMIEDTVDLSISEKNSLVSMLDKNNMRDMVIYTKLAEDMKSCQVSIRLVRDEYLGDFGVDHSVKARRMIHIRPYGTESPALSIMVPTDDTAATLYYKEDMEAFGYNAAATQIVQSVVMLVNYYIEKK